MLSPDIVEIILLIAAGLWILGIGWLYSYALRDTIKTQSEELQDLHTLLAELTLASMAFKASNETHPSTGPAVIQQLAKKAESPPAKEPLPATKPGVRMRQGAG